jgi:hypothetical protein
VVLYSWNSKYQAFRKHEELQQWGVNDYITLRNVGAKSAFNIQIGDFSWPELRWGPRIYVKALHSGEEEHIQASFWEVEEPDHRVGYMRHVLGSKRYNDRKPLSVTVSFSDANNTHFERPASLTLRWEPDDVNVGLGEPRVLCPTLAAKVTTG